MKYKIWLTGNKKVKKDKNTIHFHSNKKMKQLLKENPEIRIVGGTRLVKRTANNEHHADFLIELPESDELIYIGKKKQKGFIKGYFQINENEYLEYRSYFFLLLLFLITLLFGTLILIGVKNNDREIQGYIRPSVCEAEKWDGVIHQSGNIQGFEEERIEIPGYHELYVSINEPFVVLGNPNINMVLFKYEILKDNILIFESDYIKPGNKIDWNAYETLTKGDHKLTFSISTVDIEKYYPCNGASLSVEIDIK